MAAMDSKLVCCLGERPTWLPDDTFQSLAGSAQWFHEPTHFTRWLFSDPCGEGMPQVPLVTGWREAKPCAQAVAAVRSGDASGLRPDKGRPQLPGAVVVPILDVVVLVESFRKQAALQWAADSKFGLTIHVASGMTEFSSAMRAAMSRPAAAPARMPGCRMAAPPGLEPRAAAPRRPTAAAAPPPGLEHPDGKCFIVAPPPGLAHPHASQRSPAAACPARHPDAQRDAMARLTLLQREHLAMERERIQTDLIMARAQELLSQRLAAMALSDPGASLQTLSDVNSPLQWAEMDAARAAVAPSALEKYMAADCGLIYA